VALLVQLVMLTIDQGRFANTRPVATIEKWATGRVMQRLVLATSVGHGEPGFRLRSSVFATPIGKGCVCSFLYVLHCAVDNVVEGSNAMYEILISDFYYLLVVDLG